MSTEIHTAESVREMLEEVKEEGRARRKCRVYVKSTVADAERLPNGNWRVTGHGWLKEGVEFTDENFRANFEEL